MMPVTSSPLDSPRPTFVGAPIPAGTASLSTAVALVFTALGTPYTRGSTGYAALAAAVVALGAGHTLVALVRAQRRNLWLWVSAAGGCLTLALGMAYLLGATVNLTVVHTSVLKASYVVAPLAIVLCYCGGLLQLPPRWWPPLVATTVGATVVGHQAVQADTVTNRMVVAAAALCALVGAAVSGWMVATRPAAVSNPLPRWFILAACLITVAIMAYALAVAAIPARFWPRYAPSFLLAWGYIGAGLLASAAGLIFDFSRPLPASPSPTAGRSL